MDINSKSYNFSKLIEALITKLGSSQLAFASMIGTTHLTVHNWRHGKSIPQTKSQLKILKLCIDNNIDLPRLITPNYGSQKEWRTDLDSLLSGSNAVTRIELAKELNTNPSVICSWLNNTIPRIGTRKQISELCTSKGIKRLTPDNELEQLITSIRNATPYQQTIIRNVVNAILET